MTINGHLILLVVATGLFVRVWHNNERQRTPLAWRGDNRTVLVRPAPQPATTSGDNPSLSESNLIAQAEPLREEIWTHENCPIPLPADLQAGEYRVVNDRGRVARLVVSQRFENQAGDGGDVLSIETAAGRWYFIRIQESGNLADAGREVTADTLRSSTGEKLETACANRKFDFTGFDTAPAQSSLNADLENCPEVPALPAIDN